MDLMLAEPYITFILSTVRAYIAALENSAFFAILMVKLKVLCWRHEVTVISFNANLSLILFDSSYL